MHFRLRLIQRNRPAAPYTRTIDSGRAGPACLTDALAGARHSLSRVVASTLVVGRIDQGAQMLHGTTHGCERTTRRGAIARRCLESGLCALEVTSCVGTLDFACGRRCKGLLGRRPFRGRVRGRGLIPGLLRRRSALARRRGGIAAGRRPGGRRRRRIVRRSRRLRRPPAHGEREGKTAKHVARVNHRPLHPSVRA
jgi:hypothetical protein